MSDYRAGKRKQFLPEIDKTGGCIVGYIHMRRDFFSPLRFFSARHLPAFGGKRG